MWTKLHMCGVVYWIALNLFMFYILCFVFIVDCLTEWPIGTVAYIYVFCIRNVQVEGVGEWICYLLANSLLFILSSIL